MNNTKLLARAKELTPTLYHDIVEPIGVFQLKERYSPEKETLALQQLPHLAMGRGQNLCLDFGTHHVGYLTLELSYQGSHPDAPAYLKLKFAESLRELSENSDSYEGWLSRSWIQEEYVHVDVLPARLTLPRRYAFRYLKITVMDTSPKYKLVVKHAECITETSANIQRAVRLHTGDALTDRIYEVSLRTLANCMQGVFEDGPKRDRRLWVGDFRLQALTNYASFRNYDLVKRCLYLFAGSRFPDGRVSACIFTEPTAEADDTYYFDYSLLYVAALEEYLQEVNDRETLADLYDVALQQIELALRQCNSDHIVSDLAVNATFIDWNESLDKTASSQAVLIYTLQYAQRLARRMNDAAKEKWLMERQEELKKAALDRFWDKDAQCFLSGGQQSLASQIWMVLADVPDSDTARKLMARAAEFGESTMVTPYMHHYYLMALLSVGMEDVALAHIKDYWGGMISAGADTFWELWDPQHPEASPYGGSIVNSYCHAWSCTPAYILKKWFAR